MSGVVESAVGSTAEAVESVNDSAENTGNKLLNRLGDKMFGKTAESETNDAPVITPDATVTPVSEGRRSRRPDGQDPFRSVSADKP